MAHRGIQQMQIILDAQLLELGAGCGIEPGALTAVAHVDLIHILHQFQRLSLADVFIQRTAKIVGNVVFSVGKRTCAAETAHDRAALTANAGLDLHAVNGAMAAVQCMTRFKHSHLQLRTALRQFIGRKNTAGTGANNNHIIIRHSAAPQKIKIAGYKSTSLCSQLFTAVGRTLNHIMSLYIIFSCTTGMIPCFLPVCKG